MMFSEWWKKRWAFGFGTRWLEPLCIPMAAAAWDESAEEQTAPMSKRIATACEFSPSGTYTVLVTFSSLLEAQEAHLWVAHLKTPNAVVTC